VPGNERKRSPPALGVGRDKMNKRDREAIFENGGLIREKWDWLDLSLLIMFSAILGFIAYTSYEHSRIISYLVGFLTILFTLFSISYHFSTGRLFEISNRQPDDRDKIIIDLSELGYRATSKGKYYLKLVRDIENTKNLNHVVLFWWEGALYGYSWMDGGVRFHRMPFITGESEINRVKRKLKNANQTVQTTRASARV